MLKVCVDHYQIFKKPIIGKRKGTDSHIQKPLFQIMATSRLNHISATKDLINISRWMTVKIMIALLLGTKSLRTDIKRSTLSV